MLTIIGDPGDLLRVRLRKKKKLKLKVRQEIGKAYTEEETVRMLALAQESTSTAISLALTFTLNTGLRDHEVRELTWAQINFNKGYLVVGNSKTEAGQGRTIPLNSALRSALTEYSEWYREKFGTIRPDWYIFPFDALRHPDPSRPAVTFRGAWMTIRKKAGVKGRWHDTRHTVITDLAESGAGDQTIMDIAGHVSKQMLKHYSHIRMKAKRQALESIVKQGTDATDEEVCSIAAAEPAQSTRKPRRSLLRAQMPSNYRQDLHKKVWSVPMRKLARDFGISDVALAKRCKKLDIPVPGRGYWAKKAANKPVDPPPPLPALG